MIVPQHWNHFRYIDFHQVTEWAVGFVSLSPYNECFLWAEINISPRMNTTLAIAKEIADVSEHYKFTFDTIDPLAGVIQVNTTRSTIQDLNDYFSEFKRQGLCEGAYFVPADTKGTRGREKINQRLRNSIVAKTPFNNRADDYKGNPDVINIKNEPYLPTIWVLAPCKKIRTSLKNIRTEKDGKPTPGYLHHVSGIEFLFKDAKFRAPPLVTERRAERVTPRYFQGRRR